MRFVKFNFLNDTSILFCMDDISYMQSSSHDSNNSVITLRDGKEFEIPVPMDYLCNYIFSDESSNEYQLKEIYEQEPPSGIESIAGA